MASRKTVRRLWWVWNFEKEEQWLNNMAMEGWALEGVGVCTYHFVRCEPGEYTIRLEMHGKDDEYMEFLEGTGAEYVGRFVQWVYFRRKSEYGAFDIFSDIDSRIKHLNKIADVLRIIGIMNIVLGIINTIHPSVIGMINLLCGCLLMYALGRIRVRRMSLKKSEHCMNS